MPTVIDEFVVSVGLDPSKFTEGQKKVLAEFKKTQQAAVEGAKNAESSAANLGNSISKVTGKMLGLLSLAAGGVGLKQFVADQVRSNAETGRTAYLLETSTGALSKWRNVARLSGSTAEAFTSAIGGLSTEFEHFKQTGQSSLIPLFNQLGIDLKDIKDFEHLLTTMSDRFQKKGPSEARYIGKQFGFDEAFTKFLTHGPDNLARMVKEAQSLGTVTDEDAAAASRLEKAWTAVSIAIESTGRVVVTKAAPTVANFLDKYTKILADIREGKTSGWSLNPIRELFSGPGQGSSSFDESGFSGFSPTSSLRRKPGAGHSSLATGALAHSLQAEIPGIDRFTAFNDRYHALLGRSSAHQRGEALDFTLKNPAQAAAVAEAVRKKLANMGIDGTVLDEYNNPSKGSTGGHIHVQFNSPVAAARYAEIAQAGRGGGGPVNSGGKSSSVTIGKVEIVTQATDSPSIAATIKPAIERSSLAYQAQAGRQ